MPSRLAAVAVAAPPVAPPPPAVRRRGAPGTARRRRPARRHVPVLVAFVGAWISLLWQPLSADLAAAEYRAQLFGRQGALLWDLQWYAGHHLAGYSVTVPPLSWLLGPRLLGAVAAIAATVLFERIAWTRYGERAWVGATWFALGSATSLRSGRITFAVGLVPALGALALLQGARDGRRLRTAAAALVLGVLTALTSPVAALFLALAGTATGLTSRPRRALGLGLAAAALLPVLALSVAFPEGGREPFPLDTCAETIIFCAITMVLLPLRERTLRAGVFLYALGCAATYAIPTPVGSNVVRLGALCAGPVLALALAHAPRRRVATLALVAPFLLVWQWTAAVSDVRVAAGDPTTHPNYYRPLLAALRQQPQLPGVRLEIPFTRLHWEARWVAPHVPLARGWERQVDIDDNSVFYSTKNALTPARYRQWLDENAVAWVALPRHARLDYSAEPEARLIARGLPYLHAVWRDADWTLYAVARPTPLARGAARVTQATNHALTLEATRPGAVDLRVRWTPYWAVTRGDACVAPAGAWTRLRVRRPGTLRLEPRFALGRIAARSPRCAP
jgi:hypothetical protein